jgi:hypothetical protein
MIALAAAKSLSDPHCLRRYPPHSNELFTVDERITFSEGLLESRGNTLLFVGSVDGVFPNEIL